MRSERVRISLVSKVCQRSIAFYLQLVYLHAISVVLSVSFRGSSRPFLPFHGFRFMDVICVCRVDTERFKTTTLSRHSN